MKITHFFDEDHQETKDETGNSFILTNRAGDYLWLGEKTPQSRYEGWFCSFKEGEMYRIIESISPEGGGEISEIKNGFSFAERRDSALGENFFLPRFSHTMVYTLDKESKINIFFDVRHSYSTEEGADYTTEELGNVLLFKFKNGIFLAVKAAHSEPEKIELYRHYFADEKRNSSPFGRKVCLGLRLFGKQFIFSAGRERKEVLKEVEKIFSHYIIEERDDLDLLCARSNLLSLTAPFKPGIYAGFPWFFHFWMRDEAISLKSFLSLEEETGKAVFFRLLREGVKEGPGGACHADSMGWLYKRAEDILPLVGEEEKEKIKKALQGHIEEALWNFTEKDLAINFSRETWMDSLDRSGARIELQAMRLYMYRLAQKMAKNKEEKFFYKRLEEEMRKKVRDIFFDGKKLYDGYDLSTGKPDETIRPNIFIAAYIYPYLLREREWKRCFDHALSKLWLPWGGLASVDIKSPLFHGTHSGEPAESYHQGDSWFYLNNLAALVLYWTDKRHYRYIVCKLLQASKDEIMWKGVVGSHGEVSSASQFSSEGCRMQAWSSAMYLEAREKIPSLYLNSL